MKLTFDFKSALCGLIIGVVAMLVLGAESPSNGVGRYQTAAAPNMGIILDTKTGQAWGFGPINSTQYRNDEGFWGRKDVPQ
jgi:hypothetical protein